MARRKNPFTKYTDEFLRRWDDLAPALKDEIWEKIDQGKTPSRAVRSVFEENDLRDKLRDWFSDVQIGAVEVGIKGVVSVEKNELAMRKWFLNTHFQADDLSLSQRVTRLDLQADVISTIQANFIASNGVTKLASDLSEFTTEEDLRKGIRELETAARKVIAGDTKEFREFQKILKREQRYAESLIEGGNETVLQRAYMRVVKAAAKLNAQGLDKAIENAIDKKARSNAFRLAHNEAARAYGIGARTRASATNATGLTWELSSGEGHCNTCEELSGKHYATDDLPEYPAHPNCECNLTPFYGDDSELEDHDQLVDTMTLPEKFIDQEDK